MKTALALAAILGLSVSVAAACPMKRDTTASTDNKLTVASISSGSMSTPAERLGPETVPLIEAARALVGLEAVEPCDGHVRSHLGNEVAADAATGPGGIEIELFDPLAFDGDEADDTPVGFHDRHLLTWEHAVADEVAVLPGRVQQRHPG